MKAQFKHAQVQNLGLDQYAYKIHNKHKTNNAQEIESNQIKSDHFLGAIKMSLYYALIFLCQPFDTSLVKSLAV